MVQRIGRQFPKLEVGGSSPPGSAHGTGLAGAGGSLQNCRRPVRLRPVSLRCSRCGRPGTAGTWASRSSPVISSLNGVVRVRVPPAGLSGGSSIGRALDDPVCARTFARLPVVPGRRHRACGAGMPHPCPHRRRGRAGRRRPVIQDRKASRFESCSLRLRGPGQLSRRASGVNSGCRIPHPPGPQPSNPITSARTGGPNPNEVTS